MLALNTLAVGAASFFAVVAANHGQISRAHHHNPLLERSGAHLQKRFGGRATYYAVGLGACGKNNSPGDYIVALNSPQYIGGSPGPNCFKSIKICAKGKCAGATIMDECPGCPYGALDLSQGLFEHFASTDEGVFQMTWTYDDDNSDPDPQPTSKKPDPPKTTEKPDPPKTTKEPEPEPEPTTTSKRRTSTTSKERTTTTQPETTSTPEPTTTSSSSTSTSFVPETTSTSEAKSTMATSTVSASASPSVGAGSNSGSGSSGSNWADMAQIMLAMGRLATTAHGN